VGRTTINPIEQVAYIIDTFHRWYRCDAVELLGKRNIVPTDIKIPVGGGGGLDGRGGNSTVPDRIELTYDVRTLPGDTAETIMKLMKTNLDRVFKNGKKKYPSFREADIVFGSERCETYTGIALNQDKYAPAWKTPKDAEIVAKALAGLGRAGLPTEVGSYKFCTDGSAIAWYRDECPDQPVQIIGFGPSEEALAHVTNEYIALDQMKQALHGYAAIGAELLKSR
jgi:acetylornithine deacetylase/succinyl-diaminopimelate desuccinylase-like protein